MTRIGNLMGVSWALSAAMLLGACGPSSPQSRNPTTIAPRSDDDRQSEVEVVDEKEPPLGRLPRDVVPQEYTLALQIVPSEDRFSGSARIDVTLKKPRSVIWLHGRKLEVTKATLTPEGGDPIAAEWEQVDEESGVAALRLPQPVLPGKATIAITYSAPFDRQLDGLYRVDTGGESYAFTQFEATSARQAFPGFDEPSFKTPFDITVIAKDEHVAASTTPVVEAKEIEGGLKRVRYAKTKPLPTYLIAFAVGPLDVVEADPIPANDYRDRELPFRGLAVKGKGKQLEYALENTPELLKAMEEYFAGPHPFAKLDIVAVPDFAAGAMENVGLVTFRETLLLLDDSAPVWQKRAFAGVMAHELAHMWFGNLVTMPWRNDIWLNEAFATWMASKAVADVFPDYHADLHQIESVQHAMKQDSLMSARKIRQPIESNHDIRNAFDSITYRKGGGVLAMFERWMGEETFRDGIRMYMREHTWGNATAEDLVKSLSEAADKDVATPFNTFLTQPGLPFVNVEPTCEEGSASLELSQERYLPVGSEGDPEQSWKFPMCVKYAAGGKTKEQCTMLTEAEATMELEAEECPAWVLPNAGGAGYFRFALPSEDCEALRTEGWDELSPRDKLAVADSLRASFDNDSMET
ncbi:MAG: M1 family metallopeptidase, partial [Polyangiales bacterium]